MTAEPWPVLLALGKDRALAEVEAATRHFCDSLRALHELDAIAVGHWTVRDVAVHVAAAGGLHGG